MSTGVLTAHDTKALSYAIPACLSLGLAFCLGAHFGAKSAPSKEDPDLEREDEELADGDLSSIKPRTMEQCKLVCSTSLVKYLHIDEVQYPGVGCTHGFEDDTRESCSAVRDSSLCTETALNCLGAGMSPVLVERALCWTNYFAVTRPWHVTRHS